MDVVISYETLFEILRLERSRTELQQLPSTFIDDSLKLIHVPLGGLDEIELKKQQTYIKSTIKMLNELYDRREKKIVSMALAKTKTKAAIIDFSKFLDYEKEMFEKTLAILDKYRQAIVFEQKEFETAQKPGENTKETQQKEENSGQIPKGSDESKEPAKEESTNIAKEENKDFRVVRFLSALPSFMGPDLVEYGPYDEEEIANLPNEVVDLLIKKKRCEEIMV